MNEDSCMQFFATGSPALSKTAFNLHFLVWIESQRMADKPNAGSSGDLYLGDPAAADMDVVSKVAEKKPKAKKEKDPR